MRVLHGAVVTLRPVAPTDFEALAAIRGTPEVVRFWRGGDDPRAALEAELHEPGHDELRHDEPRHANQARRSGMVRPRLRRCAAGWTVVHARQADDGRLVIALRKAPHRLSTPLGVITAWYLAARLVAVAGFAGARAREPVGPWSRTLGMLDGAYFLDIVRNGYPSTLPVVGGSVPFTGAYFPGYPALVWLVHTVTAAPAIAAAVLVSLGAGLVTSFLVWRLVGRLVSDAVGLRTAVLVAVFPGSVVFSLAYSEGLMLALLSGALLALVARRWTLAGFLGAGATATRAIAVAIVIAAAFAAFEATRDRGEWRAWIAPAIASCGFLGALALQWGLTGEPRAWFIIEHRGWNQDVDFGRRFLDPIVDPSQWTEPRALARTGALLAVLATVWLLWRLRIPPLLLAYTVGVVLQFLLSSTVGPRPRFVLTAFPLLIVPARYVRGRWFTALCVLSLLALGGLAMAYATPDLIAP